MRKILCISIVVICALISGNTFAQQKERTEKIFFTIEGNLNDIKSNATVWLGLSEPYENKGQAFKGDVKYGKFIIKGETYDPTIGTLSLFFLDSTGKPLYQFPDAPKLELFICKGNLNVSITDSFKTISVKSSCKKEQSSLENFNKKLAVYNSELDDLYLKQFKSSRTDSMAFVQSSRRIKEILKELKPLYKKFIAANGSTFLGASIFLANLGSLFNGEESEDLYSRLSTGVKSSTTGKELWRRIDAMNNPASALVGKVMPDTEIFDLSGNSIKLSSFKGKYLLLDFWASWCGPCRKANPAMKDLYEKYGNKKLEIISVSIDKEKSKWLEAIKEDELKWPQLLDDIAPEKTGWSGKAFQLYRGVGVPTTFLIDPNGVISELNPSVESLAKIYKNLYGF